MALAAAGSLGAGPARCRSGPAPGAWPTAWLGARGDGALGSARGSSGAADGARSAAGAPSTPPGGAPPAAAPPQLPPGPGARPDGPTRREEAIPSPQRATLTDGAAPRAPRVALTEDAILRATRAAQPMLAACWRRAQRADPALQYARVLLRIEVDPRGSVASVRTDAEDERFSACLAAVARRLVFPALGRAVPLELPLIF